MRERLTKVVVFNNSFQKLINNTKSNFFNLKTFICQTIDHHLSFSLKSLPAPVTAEPCTCHADARFPLRAQPDAACRSANALALPWPRPVHPGETSGECPTTLSLPSPARYSTRGQPVR